MAKRSIEYIISHEPNVMEGYSLDISWYQMRDALREARELGKSISIGNFDSDGDRALALLKKWGEHEL